MCDCFHMVLPTWPGAPGSVSGRQLQPEEPDAESEEERSVTEGPVDEIIRPRPQGSSPVYECAAEGPGFGLPEDTAGRQAPSGRRRSWWKRQSGDPQAFSRMSHPEEATEVTLKTEVEAGASGYSVVGGGGQGIFVKQVLKGSSAAKLFSLREGDQLLSATVFFDNIKYEDALKILQYSEPYKVQFKLKRKLPAPGDVERAARGAQGTPGHTDTQDTGVADGSTDTLVRTTDTDGDQEKLLSRPGEGRGRRPQRERLSWPKFQAIKTKHGPGPRRSHSSSEAYERGKAPAASPTSSDTEAQLAAGEQGRKAGSQRRRRVLNLGFRLGAGKGPSLAGRPGGGAPGRGVWAGVLQEEGTRDDSRWDTGAAAHVGTEERREGLPDQGAEAPGASGLSTEGVPGRGVDVAPRRRRRTQEGTVLEEGVSQGKPGAGPAPGQGMGDRTEGVQARETGGAVPCLQDTPVEGHMHDHQPDFRVRILDLKVPRFGISKETALAEEGEMPTPQEGPGPERLAARAAEQRDLSTDVRLDTATAVQGPHRQRAGAGKDAEVQGKALRGEAEDVEGKTQKVTMLRTRTEVLGWAAGQDALGAAEERGQRTEAEGKRHRHVTAIHLLMESEDRRGRDVTAHEGPPTITQDRGQGPGVDTEITLKDEGLTTRDSGFTILRFQMPSAELELAGPELDVALPEGEVTLGELKGKAEGARFKGHLPKMQMPSIKVPKVDIKGPQVDIRGPKLDIKGPQGDLKGPKLDLKGAKGELAAPDVDLTLPSVEVDMQAPGAKLEGDLAVGDKEVAARDSKFKMPKFKMPSFGASAPGKSIEASADVSLPSAHADVKTGDLSMELPAADVALKTGELGVKLPEGHVPEGELQGPAAGAGLKGHLPKMHMPSLKMPKLDIQGPQVDIKGPKLDLKGAKGELAAPDVDLTLPSVEVDMQAPGAKPEGDLAVGDKEVAARDSKFKMPKFKMPSFGASAPSKDLGTSVDVPVPSLAGEVRVPEGSVQLPSAELELAGPELDVALPEGEVTLGELKGKAEGARFKGHLPKMQMPSIKVPKVDIKGPQVDIRGPKLDIKGPQGDLKGPKLDLKGAKGELAAPDVDLTLPSVEVDMQAPGAKPEGDLAVGDKEVAARDSKFKMPKFKMPSFGASAPSKDLGTSVDVPVPSLAGEVRVPEGSVQLPSAELELAGPELDVALPEGEVTLGELKGKAEGARFKGHLPKMQMPSIKVPKVDIKGPQVDIRGPKLDIKGPQGDLKGPKLDLKGAKGELAAPDVDLTLPSVEVDMQAPGAKLEGDLAVGDKEVAARDSKFKMPKFKMPSFGASAPGKSIEASADVSLPSAHADVKTGDLSMELPAADVALKTGELGVKLPEGHVPEGELQGPAAGAGLKGHLPKMHMPSLKMPKLDIQGPQVDIKGPKLDLKGAKGELAAPDVDLTLPSVEVDMQAPGAKPEGDLAVGDKEVAARDSKFKMPKFKMPSFGASAPSKDLGTSVDVPVPSLAGEVRVPEGSVQLPSAELELAGPELDVALPEGEVTLGELKGKAEGARFKGHLPKMQMPSIKVPKVDIKGPQVDIRGPKLDIKGPQGDLKGPKLDLKGAKGELAAPDVDLTLPSVEVDMQAPGAKLEGDLAVGDKEVAARDSKFKMPKFKMPSFGASAPGKSIEASADVSLPSAHADVKTGDLSMELPAADVALKTGELGVKLPEGHVPEGELQGPAAGAGLKGHLPKMHMPSLKMPKLDIQGPQVDIKGPKLDLKGAKGELAAPDVDLTLPSVEVDMQAPGAKLEGDLAVGDKEVAARDSKFKMPKFKMPSFGASAPGTSIEASADVSLPSAHADTKTGDLSMELPAADVALKTGELGVKLPEGHVPEGELQGPAAGAGLKGHLPKMHMPSLKMPKLDIQGPQVDIKGPKLDLKGAKGELAAPDVDLTLPSVEVDMQAPGAKLEGDLAVGDKEVAARDSKFKIPKVKMPLFRSSSHKASWVLPDVQDPDKGSVPPHVLDPTQSAVVLVDYCPSTVHRDDRVPFENVEEESSSRKPQFQVSPALSPPGQSGSLSTPDMGPGVHLPGPSSATPSKVGWPGSPLDGLLVISPHAEPSALPSSEGVTLTKYQMTFPRPTVVPELSQGALPESPEGAHPARSECSTGVPFWETVPLSQPDGYPGPVEHLLSTTYGRVTFPKFYQPKFRVSVPEGADAERERRDLAGALPPPSPALQGLASSAEEAPGSPRPGPELPSTGVSVPEGSEGPVGPAWTAAVAPGGCPAEHADREGKGSSLRMPRLRLPSFRRSPKKAVEPKGAPGHGLAVDDGPAGAGTEVQVPEMDVHVDVTTAEEGAESRVKTPGFVVPKLALPTVGSSTGGPGLPQGDPAAALSQPSTAGASQATPSAGGAVAGARAAEGVPEGASSDLCLPEVHLSSMSFVHADHRPAKVQVQVSQSAGGLPPNTHDLSLEAGSKGRGLGDGSVSQPGGEATDPSAEEPLPAPGQTARAAVPTTAGSMEGDPAPGSETAGSHEGWFRMPSLGLSSFWRSSKEKGEARGATQRHAAVTSAPGQQEVPAAASGQGLQVPGSEAEAAVTPQPPEAEAEAEAEADVAGFARRTLDSKCLTLHVPPAGGSAGDLPTSDVRLRPGEGSLPIQTPRGRLPETQAPPGEAGQTSTQGGERPERPCAPPEGPLTLKASRIHAPSPIAIVDLRQPWGDSALTVTFPKLKVPRFTFLAPGPEAGAAIFTPAVGTVWGPDSSLDPALREGCPGGWGAGDPREQPVVHDLSPEAPPISKVRVHIQGARVESQEVTIRSRVTAGVVGLSGSPAFSAQGVQASEVLGSETPTPSSAFSLLKGKPDPPAQARGPSVTLGSPPPDGFQEAPQLVTLGADPGAGEPFEMIPSSLSTPGPQTLEGTPFADGCSDEEPAEILEFPPEDSGDTAPPPAAEDRAAKGKPDSRRSGLFRFWPPNIGFSSSAGDAPAAGPPEKQEKAGWFRLPKLGFSSSPPKKSDSAEHEAGVAGRKLQEEAVTFFDARESFSPEDEARGAEQGSGGRESQ